MSKAIASIYTSPYLLICPPLFTPLLPSLHLYTPPRTSVNASPQSDLYTPSLTSFHAPFPSIYAHYQSPPYTLFNDTVCQRSSYPIFVVSYYIKWVITSWTDGIICRLILFQCAFY